MPEPRRNTFLTTQPGKGIWSLISLLFNAARLPLWMLYFLPSGLRQDPRWSWGKAVRMRVLRAFLTYSSTVEVVTPFNLSPGNEKDQWVTIEPADPRSYAGVAVVDKDIKPARIGGTWYPSLPGNSRKAEKVVLHFHGGAFVIGDGRTQDAGFLTKTLLKNGGVSHVFSCQYRLASNPGGRFPAALQDAITAYSYLTLKCSISPSDIIVSGDSAGANLVLCLLRYITDQGRNVGIPAPLAAWLWSPWVDPGAAITNKSTFHLSPNAPKDYLNDSFGAWGAGCYMPDKKTGLDINSEYINFIKHPFKTDVPLYYSVCENEVLLEDGKNSHDAFSKIPGNRTEISVEPMSPHDIMLVGHIAGFQQEAYDAAAKAGKWLSTL